MKRFLVLSLVFALAACGPAPLQGGATLPTADAGAPPRAAAPTASPTAAPPVVACWQPACIIILPAATAMTPTGEMIDGWRRVEVEGGGIVWVEAQQ